MFYCAQSKGVNYEKIGESLTMRVSVSRRIWLVYIHSLQLSDVSDMLNAVETL
jgi:hypothetical protein